MTELMVKKALNIVGKSTLRDHRVLPDNHLLLLNLIGTAHTGCQVIIDLWKIDPTPSNRGVNCKHVARTLPGYIMGMVEKESREAFEKAIKAYTVQILYNTQ